MAGTPCRVTDANDLDALDKAIAEANAETKRPSIIAVRSHIGYGSPLQDNAKVHGSAIPPERHQKDQRFLQMAPGTDFLCSRGSAKSAA